jgi:hypothetical protein
VTATGDAAKWAGKWLLQIPVYLVTSNAVRELIGSCYRLLLRGGALLPPNYLFQHFLWFSFVSGVLAGLVGVLLVRAMLLLPLHMAQVADRAWQRPQAWTWILPTCWLLFGMTAWSGRQAFHSALATGTGPQNSGIIAAFFGSACDFTGHGEFATTIRNCTTQLEFAHPWLGTLGYSAAAFVPAGWFGHLRRSESFAESQANHEHTEEAETESLA